MKRATVDIDSTRSLGTEATEKREGAPLLLLKIPMFRRTIRSRRSVMPRQVLRAWTRGGIRRSGADSANLGQARCGVRIAASHTRSIIGLCANVRLDVLYVAIGCELASSLP
jgi:hypothetical protein